jgi:putative mRNA 3-end processing factor
VPLPKTMSGDTATIRTAGGRGLVITPQSAFDTPWMRKFGEVSCAIASGWMQVRAARKRRAFDRGFVLSDHADWPGLLEAIRLTGAERVLVTHGPSATVVRWLTEQGIEAAPLEKAFVGDRDPSRRVENGNEDRG